MPARMAWATERNFGFSSVFRRVVASCLVKVLCNLLSAFKKKMRGRRRDYVRRDYLKGKKSF